jgi:hypothetical protein
MKENISVRLFRYSVLVLCVLLVAAGVTAVSAQQVRETRFDGFLDAQVPSKSYPVSLDAGQVLLVVTEAIDGDLDTVVSVLNPDDALVAQNDDRAENTLDSALGYIAAESGPHTVLIERYSGSDSSGHYRLRIVIGDESILEELNAITRIQLSGPALIYESPNFRVHYTLQGADAAFSMDYVIEVAQAAESAWRAQVDRMGWPVPPGDGLLGGDSRFDIYIKDLLDAGEEALGYAVPDSGVGDNPNTEAIELDASGSYLVVENDFGGATTETATELGLMRTTIEHEFNHALQFGFDAGDSHDWMYEATASWIETVTAGKDQDATGYVVDAFQYPELCFGTVSDPNEGAVQYGEWPFFQMMVDDLGAESVVRYWENVALYDGWESLEQTLAPDQIAVPDFVARYRLKNLARDYGLAPLFGATVWLENTVDDVGRWTFTGEGIQELGANYFRLTLPAGNYYAGLVNDGGALQLYAAGVLDGRVDIFSLGRGGEFDRALYDDAYLMVFNPAYDDDMNDCVYLRYDIDIAPSKTPPGAPAFTFPATYFEALTSSGG